MTASFVVTLDTRAPRLAWGAAAGLTAGELFQIAYTVDEPGVLSATLTLADGRTLSLADTGAALEVLLPADTPAGAATVRATTRDAVWNQASYSTVVELTGTIVIPPSEPPPAPPPGYPAGPRRLPRRRQPQTIATRTRIRARPAGAVLRARQHRATSRFESTASAHVAASSSGATSVRHATRYELAAAAAGSSSARAAVSAAVRRGDDPQLEAAIALGLL